MATLLESLGVSDIRHVERIPAGQHFLFFPSFTPPPPMPPPPVEIDHITIESALTGVLTATSGPFNYFATEYAPDVVFTARAYDADDNEIENPDLSGFTWQVDPQGNMAYIVVTPSLDKRTCTVSFDEDLDPFDINEDGVYVFLQSDSNPAILTSPFLAILLRAEPTSSSLSPAAMELHEGQPGIPTNTITVTVYDQFGNPILPYPGGVTLIPDNPDCVEIDNFPGPTFGNCTWVESGTAVVTGYMDVGEPPVETPSTNTCTITCENP